MKKITAIEELKALYNIENTKKYPSIPQHGRVTPKYADGTANGLTACVIAWIRLHGGQAERISIVSRKVQGKFVHSAMTVGTADVSGIYQGKSLKVEIKIGRDKQSDAQKEYAVSVEKAGGIYFVATDFDMFVDWWKGLF
jgi:penicillin-binding protein-related factor A (putative recombinase)